MMSLRAIVPAAILLALTALPLPFGSAAADTLLVSNRGDEAIQLIDTETGETIATIVAGVGAHEFAVSPDGRTVVGSCYGSGPRHQVPDHRLVVVDLNAPRTVRMIDLGDHPRPNDLRFHPDGRTVIVTSEVRQTVLVVDIEKGEVVREAKFDEPAGHMLATSPDGQRAYVPCVMSGTVVEVDLAADADPVVIGRVETAAGAEGVDLSPDGRWLWVACNRSNTIAVIDTTTRAVAESIASPGFPFRVRFTPDGSTVVVSCPMSNEVRIYDAKTREERGVVSLGEGAPTSIAIAPDGARAYIVCSGVEKIAVIDLAAMSMEEWWAVGSVPDAIAVSAVGPRLEETEGK